MKKRYFLFGGFTIYSYLCQQREYHLKERRAIMARKLYPLGIQTFERIRVEDKFYIDKTEYVYRMAHTDGTYFFLSRPRRFGKSLLLTTMKSYFEGKKDLFKGLAIEKLEKDWISYPVLHFDMSMGKHMEIAQLERYFDQQLAEQEQKWGITNPAVDANVRLISLIQTAYRETGKQSPISVWTSRMPAFAELRKMNW
jgi:hypothetical protein